MSSFGQASENQWAAASSAARERLFKRLSELGVAATTVPYPASRTVEEGKAQRGALPGTFTKNLLLRDKKKALFMVVAEEGATVNLKALAREVGANGHLGFAAPETMMDVLGVPPGALTPFALINTTTESLKVVIDRTLLGQEQINFHPLVNTESTGISPQGLLVFLRSCGHEPMIVEFTRITDPVD